MKIIFIFYIIIRIIFRVLCNTIITIGYLKGGKYNYDMDFSNLTFSDIFSSHASVIFTPIIGFFVLYHYVIDDDIRNVKKNKYTNNV